MTLPGVFLVSPDDNQTRQFITKARPGIYRWVLAHYDLFRRTFPQPAGGYFGAHSIQPGHLLYHHIKGDFQTWDSVSRLVSADYLDPNTFYPPYLNSIEFGAFDSYGPGPHKPTRGIANSFRLNEAINGMF